MLLSHIRSNVLLSMFQCNLLSFLSPCILHYALKNFLLRSKSLDLPPRQAKATASPEIRVPDL